MAPDTPLHWQLPDRDLKLATGEVHLWLADLDQPQERRRFFMECLVPDERARAQRFAFDRQRQQFVAGRGILRVLLGRILGLAPAEVKLGQDVQGKPALVGPGAAALHFNLSHSGTLALYCLARDRQVGIDLEQVRPLAELDTIVGQVLTQTEREAWHELPCQDQLEAFFRIWVRKEAYLKATGLGLTKDLSQITVSLDPGDAARLISVAGDAEETGRWSMLGLTPRAGYVAALVAGPPGWRLCAWEYPN
jgi:4'-phosphopantetheinyl transferase